MDFLFSSLFHILLTLKSYLNPLLFVIYPIFLTIYTILFVTIYGYLRL